MNEDTIKEAKGQNDTHNESEDMSCNCKNENNQEAAAEKESGESEGVENPETQEKDPLEAAKQELEEANDKYLRLVAEFDNYRKRTLKEKSELILNGGEKVLSAILPILDDMERAIANSEKSDDLDALKEGAVLIYEKFLKILGTQGLTKIQAENVEFNTDEHEAIALVPGMGDENKGKVIDCVLNGYKLNDKVIRHAKVAVGQ